jgi:hypothetical protein
MRAMTSFEETQKEFDALSVRQKEFYQLVGICIKAWATVEEKLLDICEHVLEVDSKFVSAVFFRSPSVSSRLDLTDDLLLMALPKRGKKDREDHPSVTEWKKIKLEIKRLLPTRNSLAHDPVKLTIHPPTNLPMFLPVRISKSSETLEVSTSEKEELRGRDPTQVKDAQLMQHLTEVNTLSAMLVTFISGTLRQTLP